MVGGMERLQPIDLLLQIVRQRIICCTHMRVERIAALWRKDASNEDRAHCRNLVIGMIRVPRAADIGFLVSCLADDRNLLVLIGQREIIVDVDPAPTLGKGNVIVGGEVLVAKHSDAMFVNRLLDLVHLGIAAIAQRDTRNLDPAFGCHRRKFHRHSPLEFAPVLRNYTRPLHQTEHLYQKTRRTRLASQHARC